MTDITDANPRQALNPQRSIPRPSSLPPRKTTARGVMAMENPTRGDCNQSDTDSNLGAALPGTSSDRSNASPLVAPIHRALNGNINDVSPAMPKSHSTSRMAFMRRPKRHDSSATRMRKIGARENDDETHENAEDPGVSFLYDQGYNSKAQGHEHSHDGLPRTMSEASHPMVPVPPVPEGALKKRVARIERTIAEQSAWVRNKFDLDESDSLLESCSAALVQKIMLQGRLHITNTCICFYAKIFGIVTKEKWLYSTIQSVRKRRGGFVANSVKITFTNPDTPPVIIASLNRREQTLAIISSRLSVLSPAGDFSYRAGSLEEDSEEQSADDFNARAGGDHNRSDRSNSSQHMSASDQQSRTSLEGSGGYRYIPAGSESTTSDDIPNGREHALKQEKKETGQDAEILSALDRLVWASAGDAMNEIRGKEFAKRTEQARGSFDVPALFVFNELFVGDWMDSCNQEIGNLDVQIGDWLRGENNAMTRDVAFRRPLGLRIGPKETRVKEKHFYSFTSEGGALVEIILKNLDAPYAEYFVVETYFELKPANNGRGCELIASVAVHFTKSTMLRSKIEAGALSETKGTLMKAIEMARNHVASSVSPGLVSAYIEKTQGTKNKLSKNIKNSTKPMRYPPRKQVKEANGVSAKIAVEENNCSVENDVHSGMVVKSPDASSLTQAARQQSNPTIIQVQDKASSQLLRVVAIAGLIMVCILLVLVLLSFRRMKHEFQVLQMIVREMQAGSLARNNACGA